MVKHPQSHLGYCVNGVRQNVYLRHNHSETHKHNQRRKPKLENASRYRRWEQLHHAAQIPKRVHPGRDRKPVSDAKDPLDVRYRKLRFTGEMEDLKNASKKRQAIGCPHSCIPDADVLLRLQLESSEDPLGGSSYRCTRVGEPFCHLLCGSLWPSPHGQSLSRHPCALGR